MNQSALAGILRILGINSLPRTFCFKCGISSCTGGCTNPRGLRGHAGPGRCRPPGWGVGCPSARLVHWRAAPGGMAFGGAGGGGGGYAVLVIVFWGTLMLGGIFAPPRMERALVVSGEHGMQWLPQELPNDSKLRQLVRHLVYNKFISNKHDSLHLWQEIRKYQGDLKASQNYSLVLSLVPKNKILSILAQHS